jgi:hypothetical protein
MQAGTLLLLLLSLVVSLLLGYWVYLFCKERTNTRIGLALLRATALFLLGLLLINPKISRIESEVIKPALLVAYDNSESVRALGGQEEVLDWEKRIETDADLQNSFRLQTFSFNSLLRPKDSLTFNGVQTDLGKAISQLNEFSKGEPTALALLSDGNQNTGVSYGFGQWDDAFTVFPVVVGDTTQYEDIRVRQMVLNKYAFLGNDYPLEVSWIFAGNSKGSATLEIWVNGRKLAQRALRYSIENTGGKERFYLPASQTGIQRVEARITPLSQERNTPNNSEVKRLEVLDESVKVGLVSAIAHPDLGVLKEALENNGQREVEFLKPNSSPDRWTEYSVLVLYQPQNSFRAVWDYIESSGTPYWLIGGTQTAWSFVNRRETAYQFRSLGQEEDVQANPADNFQLFNWTGFDPSDYPPLHMTFGEFDLLQAANILFNQRIRGVELRQPLLFFPDDGDTRRAVLGAEGLWRWRMHCYRTSQNFEEFDQAVSLVIRYLSASQKKNRLVAEVESSYRKGERSRITARYFDPTFVFDPSASLVLRLTTETEEKNQEIPFALRANRYEVDLSTLEAGNYTYSIVETNSKRSVSGSFEILEFNFEQLALFSQKGQLEDLAIKTGGHVFYPNQWEDFKSALLEDSRFTPRERSREIVVPLIQLKTLLFLWVIALAFEWFIRKYRGWM